MKIVYVYLDKEELTITQDVIDSHLVAQFTRFEQLAKWLIREYNITRTCLLWNEKEKFGYRYKVKYLTLKQLTDLFK